jgi:pyruvate,water dikinase
VWREDGRALDALESRYAELAEDAHPGVTEHRQIAAREAAEAKLLGATGPLRAGAARRVLSFARSLIPQREVGKANYTQCLDIARLAARAIGRALAADGVLDEPDDVFGLTYDELVADRLPKNARALATERAALREDYETTDLPDKWTGPPGRIALAGAEETIGADDRTVGVTGEPVGGGRVTGRVRVVLDPLEDQFEPGEILVCRSTDPGWASLFHLAGGVAVDMGGQMSHGAIVARELGLPCVTCTVDGTRSLRTGDLVCLDGDRGRIDVLKEAVTA